MKRDVDVMEPKRILVLGAGAIGGYLGGSLSSHGDQVLFYCRPETAAAIRQQGFRLEFPDGSAHAIQPLVVESLAEAFNSGPLNLLILAVKRYDTESIAQGLAAFVNETPVLCVQNGVGAEEDLRSMLGDVDVIPGTVTTAVSRLSRSVIRVDRPRGVGIAGDHPEAKFWVDRLSRAGVRAAHYPDADSMKWSKLLTNLIANPTSAILDMTPAEIYSHGQLFEVEMQMLREALRLMRHLGARAIDLPGTPVKLLAFCAQRLPKVLAQPLLSRAIGRGRGEKMPSFHVDLYGGSMRSEVSYLHGAVARESEKRGMRAPVNAFLTEVLTGLVEKRIDRDVYRRKPGAFLEALADHERGGKTDPRPRRR